MATGLKCGRFGIMKKLWCNTSSCKRKIDGGEIIDQKLFKISKNETRKTLYMSHLKLFSAF